MSSRVRFFFSVLLEMPLGIRGTGVSVSGSFLVGLPLSLAMLNAPGVLPAPREQPGLNGSTVLPSVRRSNPPLKSYLWSKEHLGGPVTPLVGVQGHLSLSETITKECQFRDLAR